MAVKIGIAGPFNSGKSFARRTLVHGENAFVLMPSAKAAHLTDSKGRPVRYFTVNGKTMQQQLREKREQNPNLETRDLLPVIGRLSQDKEKKVVLEGNFTIEKKLENLPAWLELIDLYMPHIKTLILPDFTHYVSHVLASEAFIKRKAGGEAFQRYVDLAGLILRSFIETIDELRPDLLVVTEYHVERNEDDPESTWRIFSPGGRMINEKFLLESYYDFFLMTHVERPTGENKDTDPVYSFVTKRWKNYNARCANLFDTALIPNDLQMVTEKVRGYSGMGPDH